MEIQTGTVHREAISSCWGETGVVMWACPSTPWCELDKGISWGWHIPIYFHAYRSQVSLFSDLCRSRSKFLLQPLNPHFFVLLQFIPWWLLAKQPKHSCMPFHDFPTIVHAHGFELLTALDWAVSLTYATLWLKGCKGFTVRSSLFPLDSSFGSKPFGRFWRFHSIL